MERRKTQKLATILAVTCPPFLREAEMEKVRQILLASTAMQTCAATDARWLSSSLPRLVRRLFSILLEWERFLAERSSHEGCRKDQPRQWAPKIMEALFLPHGIDYDTSFM